MSLYFYYLPDEECIFSFNAFSLFAASFVNNTILVMSFRSTPVKLFSICALYHLNDEKIQNPVGRRCLRHI